MSNLEKIHIFPNEETYNINKDKINIDSDLAILPLPKIPIATDTIYGLSRITEQVRAFDNIPIDENKVPTEKAIAGIVEVLSQELQQISARSTLGGWTILCEPNKPLYLSLASQDANASASFLMKKNGGTTEKTPILLGYDNITGVQTSNIITVIPNEEIVILELFEISENATIYAYQ